MTDDEITKALNDIRFYWDRLEERNKELEAALREIIMCWNYEQCAELARAALGEKKDGNV